MWGEGVRQVQRGTGRLMGSGFKGRLSYTPDMKKHIGVKSVGRRSEAGSRG